MSQNSTAVQRQDASEHELAGMLSKKHGTEVERLVQERSAGLAPKGSTKYAKATTANPGCSGK